jgi:hypothetical protein
MVPMPDWVVTAVNRMGKKQGWPRKGLKITNLRGTIYETDFEVHEDDEDAVVDQLAGVHEEDPEEDPAMNNGQQAQIDQNNLAEETYVTDDDDDVTNDDDDVPDLDDPSNDEDSDPDEEEDDDNDEDMNDEDDNTGRNIEPGAPRDIQSEIRQLQLEQQAIEREGTGDQETGTYWNQDYAHRSTRSGTSFGMQHQVDVGRKKQVCFIDELDMKNAKIKTAECHHMISVTPSGPEALEEYGYAEGLLYARLIDHMNTKVATSGECFGQQHFLQKGLKLFGKRGEDGAMKEMAQLHNRVCFRPIDVSTLTIEEKRKAQEALMFLSEKRDESVKGRMVYNGKPTREWLSREDAASPTATLESIMLTAMIDAYEGRDVMTNDVPNAFIQALLPPTKPGDPRVIMKITGVLVDMLIAIAPDVYGGFVTYEGKREVLHVEVLRAIYGMLQAALCWYEKFRGDLEGEGFVFNPYDPCVANRKVAGSQHTVVFHVDDLKSSHRKSKVNDRFAKWLEDMYGGAFGHVKTHRGKRHDYLGMALDFNTKGKVVVDMVPYVKEMLEGFPLDPDYTTPKPTPAPEDLFGQGDDEVPLLTRDKADLLHTMVMKGMFVCKRARPDIQTPVAYLCTRVSKSDSSDWRKLQHMMSYLKGTMDLVLTLGIDNIRVLKWYVDASFAVHKDFKSHTGGGLTMGTGFPIAVSRKQKLNTKSSTIAELVGADDMSVLILWTKLFMGYQGYEVENNLAEDNQSAQLLLENGRKSAGKQSRAINVRYFFLSDQVKQGNLTIEYCPTDKMVADFWTKPLQGKKFREFRRRIMGMA